MQTNISRRLDDQRGVTLMELMVTLMVVSILMAITIPTASTYMARQELKAAAREVVEVFREARETAINHGQPHYVLFTPSTRGYRMYRFDGTAWVAAGGSETFDTAVSFTDADVTFPSLTNTPVNGVNVPENAAYFDTRGRYAFPAPAASYTITLRARGGRTEVLTLYTATGQVTGV